MSNDPFEETPVSRRQFARLAAATGTALALPGNAMASVSADAFDDDYAFVQNHTPTDYTVPTLALFADADGLSAIESIADSPITTTNPRPAAYTRLTASEAEKVAALPTAETLSHSPGSNPFWRIGYYPLGVFPEPRRSTDFVDYEQMVDGLHYLESKHPDRLNLVSAGQSPGHYNYLSDREDPKDIWFAELTNDITDEGSFREKTKVFYSLSLHGLERAGVEGACRFIEGLLHGNEPETESLLDDAVLVFGFTNPDGWVAKHPQYESGWQLSGPDSGAPVAPFYERGNAEVFDTNRQYPVVGWIDPAHYPAEPDGANLIDDGPGVDSDVPRRSRVHAPDALAIIEHLRSYENLDYGTDMHGALNSENFVEGLIGQAKFDHGQFHELYGMCLAIDEDLEAAMETWTTAGDALEPASGTVGGAQGVVPEQAFDYAAVWDTIGYSGTGFLGDWLPQPETLGGLDLISLDFEMAYSHMVGANVYDPELVEMQVTGYRAAIRTLAEYATSTVTSHIETGGASTAVVTTDALTRSSAELDFGETTTSSTTQQETLTAEGTTASSRVPEDVHTLSVHPHVEDVPVPATLRSPAGDAVRSFDPTDAQKGARCCGMADWTLTNPEPGEWTVEFAGAETATPSAVEFTTMQVADGTNPDPHDALGYDQRDYEVSPLGYFDDYEAFADGEFDRIPVEKVTGNRLTRYDNVVVIHDEQVDDRTYVDALQQFVDDGGNLVVTDAGVTLLGELDTGIDAGAVARDTFYLGYIDERVEDHPLLADTRPIQRELWKIASLGYSDANEAPMYLIDEAPFTGAGGTVAGRTDGRVAAGTLSLGDGSVQVLGGMLPPASQDHLHPFGLLDYCVSFLAHTVLTNALGFQQIREVNGEEMRRLGSSKDQ